MSTRNTVQSDREKVFRNGFRRVVAGILLGNRDLGNVKNHLFYKVSLCFGATFQIVFER